MCHVEFQNPKIYGSATLALAIAGWRCLASPCRNRGTEPSRHDKAQRRGTEKYLRFYGAAARRVLHEEVVREDAMTWASAATVSTVWFGSFPGLLRLPGP